MKLFFRFFSVFTFIFLFANIGLATDNLNQNGPVAVVSHPDYRFSSVLDGKEISHEFTVKNRGEALLKITRVKTT
jgi:hypothetical protein